MTTNLDIGNRALQVMGSRILDRLLSKVDIQDDGCWLFTGALVSGYGQLKVHGIVEYAHRVSWQIHMGPIPVGLYVLHKCDVRNCINPEHLFLGSYKDNSDDMIAKGRDVHDGRLVQGEYNGQHVLKPTQVLEIRGLLQQGCSQYRIADKYGVSRGAIKKIKEGRTWRHI